MTDKVQKIREEVEKLFNHVKDSNFESDSGAFYYLKDLLSFIDSLQEEPKSKFDCCILPGDDVRYNEELGCRVNLTQLQRVAKKDPKYCMYSKDSYTDEERKVLCDGCEEDCEYSKKEEPVSEVWHDASEEPDDMSHCIIYYGCKESVGHYLHYEPVLYNKKEKMFITSSFPHPTGYKVEQKSFDGGCVAEVYKDRRDHISISDITQWCYLYDLHNISNIEKTKNSKKEEHVSEDLEEAAEKYAQEAHSHPVDRNVGKADFIAGAKWQKAKLMANATDVTVHIDAGKYPYIPQMELYDYDKDMPLAKEGNKYKVLLIKEE